MELYLLRHGAAQDFHPAGDAARELTSEGREKVKAVLRTARRAGMNPAVILASPYKRAAQTAALAGEFTTIGSLTPHGRPEDVWRDLNDYRSEPAVLLASHEPLMSSLAAWLLNSPGLRLEMKKSALIRIDVSPGSGQPHGTLRWMLTPALAQ